MCVPACLVKVDEHLRGTLVSRFDHLTQIDALETEGVAIYGWESAGTSPK
jgi:hypothetical protein